MRWRVWMTVASSVLVVVLNTGGLGEELADRDRIGGVVGALVDHLEHVIGSEDRRRDLHAAGAPAVGHRHFPAGERHLIARDRDRLEDRAADHPLGLLVEIGEIVYRRAHSAASRMALSPSRGAARTPRAFAAPVRARPGNPRSAAASGARRNRSPARCRSATARIPRPAPAPFELFAELARAQGAIDQRHGHRLALALPERQPIAAREARRLGRRALELVDHLAFGHGDAAERNREADALRRRTRPRPRRIGSRRRTDGFGRSRAGSSSRAPAGSLRRRGRGSAGEDRVRPETTAARA